MKSLTPTELTCHTSTLKLRGGYDDEFRKGRLLRRISPGASRRSKLVNLDLQWRLGQAIVRGGKWTRVVEYGCGRIDSVCQGEGICRPSKAKTGCDLGIALGCRWISRHHHNPSGNSLLTARFSSISFPLFLFAILFTFAHPSPSFSQIRSIR